MIPLRVGSKCWTMTNAMPLFSGTRLRALRPSPDGRWVAVTRTMEPDPAANGLFVVATDGHGEPRPVTPFGGYRWRDGGRLLVIPQELDAAAMRLVEVDAASGRSEVLAAPPGQQFRVAAGEWSVAPDGHALAFRSADDDAVWVMGLGGRGE